MRWTLILDRLIDRPLIAYSGIFISCICLYIGTVTGGYLFDDHPLYLENMSVMKGVKGIPELMTTDAFASQYNRHGSNNALAGGRYRPLSLVTFALEVELFDLKAMAWFSHLVNVLLYAGICVLVLHFLFRDLFPGQLAMTLSMTLIFALHPIHSEVILNVKSRDELLCFFFMLLALITRRRFCVIPGVFFVLAILSKEYAVTLLVLYPLLHYIKRERGGFLLLMSLLVGFFCVYLFARVSFVGIAPDFTGLSVLNDPYALATGAEKTASIIHVLGLYVGKLIFPHPLAYDYSFNQIPYVNFGNARVWITAIGYVGLNLWCLKLLRNRSPLAFAIAFFLGTLFLVSNIVINTGQMMAERFLFHPSFGFAILVGWVFHRLLRIIPQYQKLVGVFATTCILLAVVRIGTRIPDWRSEAHLYKHDVRLLDGNALAHCNAAAKYLDDYHLEAVGSAKEALYRKAMYHAKKALELYPDDEITQLNLGYLFFSRGEFDLAEARWEIARNLSINHPSLKRFDRLLATEFFSQGLQLGRDGEFHESAARFRKVVRLKPDNWHAYYYLGGALAELKDFERANIAWDPIRPVSWLGFDEEPSFEAPD